MGVFWVIFLVVWLIGGLTSKRTARRAAGPWIARVFFVLIILIALQMPGFHGAFNYLFKPIPNASLNWLGVLFSGIGFALAIWARFFLGRNWGMPMSLKENPELVTSGPYAYIRHPIYSGLLLAVVGSALTMGPWWFIMLIVSGMYFFYAAKHEEKLMLQEFPNQYPAYKAHTKMLVPFVF